MNIKNSLVGGVAVGALLLLGCGAADAQTIKQLEQQIQQMQQNSQAQVQALQAQINQMKDQQRQQAEQAEVVRQQAAQAAAEVKKSHGVGGTYKVGGVTLKVGGFIEAAGIYRSSNETADVGSNFGNGVPFSASPNNHLSEFRMSARQSRLSLLATGDPDPVTKLTAYWEMDFLGQAATANSNESNSFNPRLRHAYAEYDRSDWGFSLIGGQTWSLATLNSAGMAPTKVVTPLTIDAQYNVGFNWTRAPQIRLVENFAPGFWGGISFENPQALPYGNGAFPTLRINNPGVGGGLLNGAGSFTLDVVPDTIVKVVAEPGWGHFELYGLAREFRTQNFAPPVNSKLTAWGGGIGGGAILPVLPKQLEVTGNVLWGSGIGKYASGQLPDFSINAFGKPAPIQEIEAMLGVIGHPDPALDLYGYLGIEQAQKNTASVGGVAVGYGNPLFSNAGCATGNGGLVVGAQTKVCDINRLWQGQVGAWWKFYQGEFGLMEVGASYSYVHVGTFNSASGAPSTNNNIVMTSFRYYPF